MIDVIRVVQQPTNVGLAMPGQLDPYWTVAVYSKVTGFVKSGGGARNRRDQARAGGSSQGNPTGRVFERRMGEES
jgi:hypothetical protein